MGSINKKGELILKEINRSTHTLTAEQVYRILSLQNMLLPYSELTDNKNQVEIIPKIRWKVPNKTKQGGNFNIEKFKKQFYDLEK